MTSDADSELCNRPGDAGWTVEQYKSSGFAFFPRSVSEAYSNRGNAIGQQKFQAVPAAPDINSGCQESDRLKKLPMSRGFKPRSDRSRPRDHRCSQSHLALSSAFWR